MPCVVMLLSGMSSISSNITSAMSGTIGFIITQVEYMYTFNWVLPWQQAGTYIAKKVAAIETVPVGRTFVAEASLAFPDLQYYIEVS